MKLTAANVRSATLPKGKADAIFFDDDVGGFGLRLRKHGSRTFIFQYKIGTKQRRMVLGVASDQTLPTARKTALNIQARVRLGHDPADDKAIAQKQAGERFGASVTAFLETLKPRYRPRAFAEIERHLMKHAKALHGMRVAKITRRDITETIEAVTKQGHAVTANKVRSSLSTFFVWGLKRGLAEANPVIDTEKNKEASRDRVLTPAELRTIWNAVGDDQYGAIIKLLTLTGQREGEIAGLRRDEIHDDMIVLPADRTKNGRPHVVPLSAAALALVAQQPDRDRDLIFGNGSGPFSGWSKSKERLDVRIAKANSKALPHWTLHDLRRTFASYAGGGLPAHQLAQLPARDKELARGLEIAPHVIEAILNHVSGHKAGVVQVYQRGTYEREKRIALDTWAAHLTAIVEGRDRKVIAFQKS